MLNEIACLKGIVLKWRLIVEQVYFLIGKDFDLSGFHVPNSFTDTHAL